METPENNSSNEYVSSKGKVCKQCGKPLDTITTKTFLCKECRGKEWSKDQRARFKNKYGIDNPMRDKKIVEKIQNTMQERYGANCAMNVPEFRKKFEDTCEKRYGEKYYVNTAEFLSNSSSRSQINKRFEELLTQEGIAFETECVRDDKRFDIGIPDRKIYIEIDPTYYHSPVGTHNSKGVDKKYHITKTLIANKYGYRCIHVFDWDNWNDIIDLIKPTQRIYARKCTLRVINDKSYDAFIDVNHIQGNCKGTKIALGLYYKNELVQVMTFGKPRYNHNYRWELLRLCTKKGYTVVGGASKLFNHAINHLEIDSIISYCDRAKFSGTVYTKMGMKLLRESIPNEIWSKGTKYITGSLLRQKGYDKLFDANYGKGTSNEGLMLANNWLPIYDCGQFVFTYGDPISKEKAPEEEEGADYNALMKSIDKSKEKICEFCGLPFVPRSHIQRYCKRPHYMNCPVCGKRYLVTNNENLKRPPVACSYECRVKRTQETSMKKYGTKAPGNNPEARKKAKETTQKKYGVDYAMQSDKIREKAVQTLEEKYGVSNAKHIQGASEQAAQTRLDNWNKLLEDELPLKIVPSEPSPVFKIEEENMQVFILKEKASSSFLKRYGHRINPVFGKIHMSVGLVDDGILYQVLRFERKDGKIHLADFGTRGNYVNPNMYTKLMEAALQTVGIEEFDCLIPRSLATPELIQSLSVRKVKSGMYKAYWKIGDELKQVVSTDNITEMKKKYDYITSDYLDEYKSKGQDS